MTPQWTDRTREDRIFETLGKLEAGQLALGAQQTQQIVASERQHIENSGRLHNLEVKQTELGVHINELLQLRSWAFRLLLAMAGIGLAALGSTKHGWEIIAKLFSGNGSS